MLEGPTSELPLAWPELQDKLKGSRERQSCRDIKYFKVTSNKPGFRIALHLISGAWKIDIKTVPCTFALASCVFVSILKGLASVLHVLCCCCCSLQWDACVTWSRMSRQEITISYHTPITFIPDWGEFGEPEFICIHLVIFSLLTLPATLPFTIEPNGPGESQSLRQTWQEIRHLGFGDVSKC